MLSMYREIDVCRSDMDFFSERFGVTETSKSWDYRAIALCHLVTGRDWVIVLGCTYLLWAPVALADVLAVLEHGEDLLDGSLLLLELLHLERLTTTSCLLDELLKGLLDELNVLETELLADDVQVTDGVDITLDVNDLGIVEASNDLENGIDSADVRQEGVTKTSTGRGTTRQTGDIVDGQVGRDPRLGVVHLAQVIEAVIGDEDTRLLGVDGGIGEVGRVTKRALGDGLEERRFTDVGKADLAFTVNM
jgi:hypothetical protein